ncbi:MAG: cytidylyltransferase domain-containing protein [Acholeplasmataceae bacterium]
MNIKSVILARGGSKGIPQKNIIPIHGIPLLHYTALASIHSNVSETWISTNCDDIKKTAQSIGCNIIDRPKKLCTDESKSDEALIHFAKNVDFDILVFIQPTSPLIKPDDINEGIKLLIENEYDSIFSAYKEHWIPRWTLKGIPHNWDVTNRPMRQDVDELFVENGAIYITTRDQLLNSKLRYGGKIGILEMPINRSFQIDSFEDLRLIEQLLS